jgi:lysophospholipase L1-like esterase
MKDPTRRIALVLTLLGCAGIAPHASAATPATTVTHEIFHGWNAIVLRNPVVEAIVVPEIGRVMEFNLLDGKGGAQGPFWKNPAFGKDLKPDGEGWINPGGDKAWPAPQTNWRKITGRGWPPPKTFDAAPYTASIKDSGLELVSLINSNYGIRIRRMISLDPLKPVMTIQTVYERMPDKNDQDKEVQGAELPVGVWTITQLNPPERAFILLPEHSALPQGYISFLPAAPATPKNLSINGRLLSVSRDPKDDTMLGSDGETLLWVGDGPDLLIENKSPQAPDATAQWPEQGSHSSIYTNGGDSAKYIELELLNSLHALKPGQDASMKTTYTLVARTESDVLLEAEKVLGQPEDAMAAATMNLENWRNSRAAMLRDDFAELARYRDANAQLKPPAQGEKRVVFFGDSITDGWPLDQYFPGKAYVNRGIGGQTTPQMLIRFREDVIDLRPAVVVILAGTNDIAGNTGPMSLQEIEANYASLAELGRAHGIQVVFSSVIPVHNYTPQAANFSVRRPMSKIRELNRWMQEYCRANGYAYLDYFSSMIDDAGFLKKELSEDGLHPNTAGYRLMTPLAENGIEKALR